MKTTRLLIADDHKMFAETLARALREWYPGIDCVYSIADLEGKLCHAVVDVVTLDLTFHGDSALPKLPPLVKAHPGVRFVVLTASARKVLVAAARRAGAIGYVIKESGVAELRRAIDDAMVGKEYVSPSLRPGAVRPVGMRTSPLPGETTLRPTGREMQILKLLHQGHRQSAIAEKMGIDRKTVEYHIQKAGELLGLRGAAMLTLWYEEWLEDPRK